MSSWNRIDLNNDRVQKLGSQYNFPPVQPISKISSAEISRPIRNKNSEYVHRFAGLAVGLASIASEHILSHPCIVLRRQCQVHNTSARSHLTPFTLFPTIYYLQRHQSVTSLWKGIGSTLMVKGIAVASEATIHELTPLPKDINRHCSLKKMAEHILLKGLAFIIVTPFFAASLVETVQSEIACEKPGVFDCIIEGFARLASFTSSTPTRLIPIWKLLIPTAIFGVAHYIIASLAMYRVSASMKAEIERSSDDAAERTIYEVHYPELVATFTGNLLADTILYPFETVLHRLFLQGTRTIIDNTDTGLEVVPIMTRYEGVFDCYTTILEEEGMSGLYKGFGALILQYGLHIAILKLTRFIFELLSSGNNDASNKVRHAPSTSFGSQQFSNVPYDPSLQYRGRDSRFGKSDGNMF
ncbi:hypothetical protein HELRODRAFT_185089 [Helobdella robusta]|uniref:Solute carrier family 25 member 46 n=1 Tax=Helobdella robusta TaxID=6412 RepID=T1FMD7_HELRO|nr:hypothetical protein HELRODRAFT_185089 [Helobdella robusta]ESN96550.1 hypothetical protein HELRODRAFT_185089 [Helobdella robusta]